jgi:hypothetical protein
MIGLVAEIGGWIAPIGSGTFDIKERSRACTDYQLCGAGSPLSRTAAAAPCARHDLPGERDPQAPVLRAEFDAADHELVHIR